MWVRPAGTDRPSRPASPRTARAACSRGNATPGNAAYGASKRAIVQLASSLAAECRGSGVGIHLLSPGMVATDLLLRAANNPRSGSCIRCLRERTCMYIWLQLLVPSAACLARLVPPLLPLHPPPRPTSLRPPTPHPTHQAARVINILAEEPATVAAWLVPRMR